MSHDHTNHTTPKEPVSKLVRICDAAVGVVCAIILIASYIFIKIEAEINYDYYTKQFVFYMPYISWAVLTLAMIYAGLVREWLKKR